MNSTGMNTATRARVIDTIVGPISRAPLMAACQRLSPCSWRQTIASTITIASSTTKPTLRVRAISEMLSSEKPSTAMAPKVATSDTTTASDGRAVAMPVPRNRATTATTRATVTTRLIWTSWMASRIDSERSNSTSTWMAPGICCSSSGSSARIASAMATVLLPGWRCTASTIERVPLYQLASRSLATLSLTSATSPRRTGEPLRKATTSCR